MAKAVTRFPFGINLFFHFPERAVATPHPHGHAFTATRMRECHRLDRGVL